MSKSREYKLVTNEEEVTFIAHNIQEQDGTVTFDVDDEQSRTTLNALFSEDCVNYWWVEGLNLYARVVSMIFFEEHIFVEMVMRDEIQSGME